MSIILAIIVLMGLFILGIRLWKTSRIVSLLFILPVLAIFLFAGYVFFNSWYHTAPDSLNFTVEKENQSYTVTGVWKKPLDAYRFPTDFIVFYVPGNGEVTEVKRNRSEDYEKMDSLYFEDSVQEWLKNEQPPELEPQLFDIETSREFSFSFALPENVKPDEVKIYYVHMRDEPMEALEFWFKEIELK
ncbi:MULTISPECIES: hypothetical protein [Bacillaceae]|uniref:hypothetical protein n=1 Tax=Bacillaceae TaxID=186817 RepID=UPI000BA58758|nr:MULTISPECIES: hypothetical protein [Bacillaceae]PAE26080.1 hypothetical protein CHI10_04480 [Bacillus sp. 7894-2]URM34858.1 hypothetical protein LLY41_11000 [Cytobacillus firmus]